MSIKPARVQFNGGELSPWLEGRTDIAKYDKTAKLCRNFIPLAEGSLKRRGGTHFVAVTAADNEVSLKIKATPSEAKVVIGGDMRNEISVARGDTVTYEVSAPGYAPQSGSIRITEDKTLNVELISTSENYLLTIICQPAYATVKINGYERKTARFNKGKIAEYIVYCDGYVLQSGSVAMTENKSLRITLVAEGTPEYQYGDWGNLEEFVCCSQVGNWEILEKCFFLKFSNGYLPIVFPANQEAPTRIDESMFFTSSHDGYNALVHKNGAYYKAILSRDGNTAIYYREYDGSLVGGYDCLTMMVCGWSLDEDRNYAGIYKRYDAVITSGALKVYHYGNLVWELKGRNND